MLVIKVIIHVTLDRVVYVISCEFLLYSLPLTTITVFSKVDERNEIARQNYKLWFL